MVTAIRPSAAAAAAAPDTFETYPMTRASAPMTARGPGDPVAPPSVEGAVGGVLEPRVVEAVVRLGDPLHPRIALGLLLGAALLGPVAPRLADRLHERGVGLDDLRL